MSIDDAIVSFVAVVVASALVMAGIGNGDAVADSMPDAGCTAEIVSELEIQKHSMKIIVEQSQTARSIVEELSRKGSIHER